MPTLFKPQDTQNKEQETPNAGQPEPAAPPAGPVSVSGSEASSENAAPNQATPAGKPTSSGRFQNLNAYLKANSGANVGNRVNDTLSSQGNQLQQNFATAKQNYQQSVDNARQRYDQNLVSQAGQDPAAFVKNQDNVNKFNKMRDASYQGPTEMDQDYNLRGQAQNFSDLAGQTGTEQGRYGVLRQIYNKPTYSQGQQNLDNLLLQSNPEQLKQLQDSRVLANQIQSQLGNTLNQGKTYANEAQKETDLTRNQTRSALDNLVTGFDSGMTGNVKNAISDYNQRFQDEQKALQSGKLGSDDLAKLINNGDLYKLGDKGLNIYNLNPANYLNKSQNYNPDDVNTINQLKTQVAQSGDYNKINALRQLEGNLAQGDVSKVLDTYSNPQMAGQFQQQTPYSFDTSKFQGDLGNVKNEYQTKSGATQGLIGQAQNALNGPEKITQRYQASIANAQKAYNDAKYLGDFGMGPKVPDNMSPEDMIRQFGNAEDNTMLARYTFENQKIAKAQQDLASLGRTYGIDRMLTATDADKYAPVSFGGVGSRNTQASNPINESGSAQRNANVRMPTAPVDSDEQMTRAIDTPTTAQPVGNNILPNPESAPFAGLVGKLGRRI